MTMASFRELLETKAKTGRIEEIIELTHLFYSDNHGILSAEQKLEALCSVALISISDIDFIISQHSEVERTVKGHAFESVFDAMMAYNGIKSAEVGGDSDVDREINGFTLQLKTPFVNGCKPGIVSYKTHKTHGAKSENESMGYYHRFDDFADFLVGLISYNPFRVLIIKKDELPPVEKDRHYIKSPADFSIANRNQCNNFSRLGITQDLQFPGSVVSPGENELLPMTAKKLNVKTEFIVSAIFDAANFRIWDMNMRGFIREFVLLRQIKRFDIKVYPVTAYSSSSGRADKIDVLLKTRLERRFVRFQVKGLTWGNMKTLERIDCETQLSRGRINDNPTQSRLYHESDFDYLIIMIDPVYENQLSLSNGLGKNYNWGMYCIPTSVLDRHHKFTHRIKPHQYIGYRELQSYRIKDEWFSLWETNRG